MSYRQDQGQPQYQAQYQQGANTNQQLQSSQQYQQDPNPPNPNQQGGQQYQSYQQYQQPNQPIHQGTYNAYPDADPQSHQLPTTHQHNSVKDWNDPPAITKASTSGIQPNVQRIITSLVNNLQATKQNSRIWLDTEKKVEMLIEMVGEDKVDAYGLSKIMEIVELIDAKRFDVAKMECVDLMIARLDLTMAITGLKRLIDMLK